KGRETETEMYFEQPQGNLVLTKETASAEQAAASYSGPHKELFGKYHRDGRTVEIKAHFDKAILVVPRQPAYTLVEKEKDNFGAAEWPDSHHIAIRRDNSGKVVGILFKQPEGGFEFERIATIEELMAKVIAAAGGEANLRKRQSMVVTSTLELENQGMTGEATSFARAPNFAATKVIMMALGKKVGAIRLYFDGANGGKETSFAPSEVFSGKRLENARIAADFYGPLNWKTNFKEAKIKEMSKVGEEEVYVVIKTPEKGNAITDYISAKTFLLVKRDMFNATVAWNQGSQLISETFSDFRSIGGIMIPFQSVSNHPEL